MGVKPFEAEPIRNGHPRFYELLDKMAETHSAKNHDYAKVDDPLSNLRQSESIGVPAWKGCVIRMLDKVDRIKGFAERGKLEVKDESVTDTLLDLAVYSILDIILYEEQTCVEQ